MTRQRKRKDSLLGQIFESNSNGKFLVLSESKNDNQNGFVYEIEFLNTGGRRKNVSRTCIKTGFISDFLAPSFPFHPKACFGYIDSNNLTESEYRSLYSTWQKMLARCYEKDNQDYYLYGAREIEVCERWWIFANFLKDVQLIPDWNLKRKDWELYSLNKDFKKNENGKFWYSPETTNWATPIEQAASRRSMRLFRAVSPTGKVIITKNIKKFAESIDGNHSQICACLNGRCRTCKGWTFQYLEQK